MGRQERKGGRSRRYPRSEPTPGWTGRASRSGCCWQPTWYASAIRRRKSGSSRIRTGRAMRLLCGITVTGPKSFTIARKRSNNRRTWGSLRANSAVTSKVSQECHWFRVVNRSAHRGHCQSSGLEPAGASSRSAEGSSGHVVKPAAGNFCRIASTLSAAPSKKRIGMVRPHFVDHKASATSLPWDGNRRREITTAVGGARLQLGEVSRTDLDAPTRTPESRGQLARLDLVPVHEPQNTQNLASGHDVPLRLASRESYAVGLGAVAGAASRPTVNVAG